MCTHYTDATFWRVSTYRIKLITDNDVITEAYVAYGAQEVTDVAFKGYKKVLPGITEWI